MTKKPTLEREVAIRSTLQTVAIIYLYATRDAITDIESLGTIREHSDLSNCYILEVDKRIDFQKVVDYLNSYG